MERTIARTPDFAEVQALADFHTGGVSTTLPTLAAIAAGTLAEEDMGLTMRGYLHVELSRLERMATSNVHGHAGRVPIVDAACIRAWADRLACIGGDTFRMPPADVCAIADCDELAIPSERNNDRLCGRHSL